MLLSLMPFGTWSISGLFQSIVTTDLSHTVEVLENSSTVLLAPTVVSPSNPTVNFGATLSLAACDTIDFIVDGTPEFADFSTGLSATIRPLSVPEPSSMMMAVVGSFLLAGGAYFRRTRNSARRGCYHSMTVGGIKSGIKGSRG